MAKTKRQTSKKKTDPRNNKAPNPILEEVKHGASAKTEPNKTTEEKELEEKAKEERKWRNITTKRFQELMGESFTTQLKAYRGDLANFVSPEFNDYFRLFSGNKEEASNGDLPFGEFKAKQISTVSAGVRDLKSFESSLSRLLKKGIGVDVASNLTGFDISSAISANAGPAEAANLVSRGAVRGLYSDFIRSTGEHPTETAHRLSISLKTELAKFIDQKKKEKERAKQNRLAEQERVKTQRQAARDKKISEETERRAYRQQTSDERFDALQSLREDRERKSWAIEAAKKGLSPDEVNALSEEDRKEYDEASLNRRRANYAKVIREGYITPPPNETPEHWAQVIESGGQDDWFRNHPRDWSDNRTALYVERIKIQREREEANRKHQEAQRKEQARQANEREREIQSRQENMAKSFEAQGLHEMAARARRGDFRADVTSQSGWQYWSDEEYSVRAGRKKDQDKRAKEQEKTQREQDKELEHKRQLWSEYQELDAKANDRRFTEVDRFGITSGTAGRDAEFANMSATDILGKIAEAKDRVNDKMANESEISEIAADIKRTVKILTGINLNTKQAKELAKKVQSGGTGGMLNISKLANVLGPMLRVAGIAAFGAKYADNQFKENLTVLDTMSKTNYLAESYGIDKGLAKKEYAFGKQYGINTEDVMREDARYQKGVAGLMMGNTSFFDPYLKSGVRFSKEAFQGDKEAFNRDLAAYFNDKNVLDVMKKNLIAAMYSGNEKMIQMYSSWGDAKNLTQEEEGQIPLFADEGKEREARKSRIIQQNYEQKVKDIKSRPFFDAQETPTKEITLANGKKFTLEEPGHGLNKIRPIALMQAYVQKLFNNIFPDEQTTNDFAKIQPVPSVYSVEQESKALTDSSNSSTINDNRRNEYHSTFNITGNDPEEISRKVDEKMREMSDDSTLQIQRGRTVLGGR